MKKMIRVGLNRRVAFRYIMKNSSGEIIANTMDAKSVAFVFGSGEILPALENELNGLKIGEKKTFSVSGDDAPGLPGTFHFHVVIDNIWWAEDLPAKAEESTAGVLPCASDCFCHAS